MSAEDDPLLLFFALLAVLCQAFVVVMAVFALAASTSPAMRVRRRAVARALTPVAAPFALAIATVTTLGSLYMSEVKHYIPCHLCWAQRVLLYPQVLWTAILVFRPANIWARRAALVMVMADMPVSLYHYFLQEDTFGLQTSTSCDPNNPCTQQYFSFFGYISEPLMALSAAAAIFTLLTLQKALALREFLVGTAAAAAIFCLIVPAGASAWTIAPVVVAALGIFAVLDRRSATPPIAKD